VKLPPVDKKTRGRLGVPGDETDVILTQPVAEFGFDRGGEVLGHILGDLGQTTAEACCHGRK